MFIGWKFEGNKCENLVFEVLGWKQMFLKNFKLILIHFIHEILWIECFLHKTSVVFQKIQISRILMNRMCFSTNRKSLEFISLVFAWFDWSSIGARSVESVFQFIETNFWQIVILKICKANFLFGSIGTRLVLDRLRFKRKEKQKTFLSTCSSLFQTLFSSFLPFLSQPIQSKLFLSFSSSNLQWFLSLSIGKT